MPPKAARTPAQIRGRKRILLVTDPKFPGGTSSAISDEIPILSRSHDLRFAALKTQMFRGRDLNQRLKRTLDSEGIKIIWEAENLQADVIVFHNPAALKFEERLPFRMTADTCVVVTHENFVGPPSSPDDRTPAPPTFDATSALQMIDTALLARQKFLAPVSAYNRRTVLNWCDSPEAQASGLPESWALAPALWPNICRAEFTAPTATPQDRRGRHSRPGNEKFPRRDAMETLFPPHAEANVILGADGMLETDPPAHWDLHPFGTLTLTEFFSKIDFFVYFTNPFWRESFGRVIAEAIAAGKVVISDEGTAEVFGSGVIAARPNEVDGHIARLIADPEAYQAKVLEAQAGLAAFSPESYQTCVDTILATVGGRTRSKP